MANLTIRMDPEEKQALAAWASVRGKTTTDYIKGLISADMAAGTPEQRAEAWFRENEAALKAERKRIDERGIPGSDIALNYPFRDEAV